MNSAETVVDDKIKPVPGWPKFGFPLMLLTLVLLIGACVIYFLTKSNAAPVDVNIDPPGGLGVNAATNASANKIVDKPSNKMDGPLLKAFSSATGVAVLSPKVAAVSASLNDTTNIAPSPGTSNNVMNVDAGPQLIRLSEQLGQLQILVNQLSDVSGQLNQRIAQLDERLPKVAAKQVVTPAAVRRSLVKPTMNVPTPVATNPLPTDVPTLIAVDSWDGRPSVSIQTARGIVFASEGDQVDGWQLVSTNAQAQRAEFYRPANGNVTVNAAISSPGTR
jgi:hypothetical protein